MKSVQRRRRLGALAEQAAHSRIYAGIHDRFDGETGLEVGRRVARLVLDSDVRGHKKFTVR